MNLTILLLFSDKYLENGDHTMENYSLDMEKKDQKNKDSIYNKER